MSAKQGTSTTTTDDDTSEPNVVVKTHVINPANIKPTALPTAETTKEQRLAKNAPDDPIKVKGVNWVLVSLVGPPGWKTNQQSNQLAMKVRGAFKRKADADAWAKRLSKVCPDADIYTLKMYSWTVLPPREDQLQVTYGDEKIDKLLEQHNQRNLEKEQERAMRRTLAAAGIDTVTDDSKRPDEAAVMEAMFPDRDEPEPDDITDMFIAQTGAAAADDGSDSDSD
jgi:hypothetical protein